MEKREKWWGASELPVRACHHSHSIFSILPARFIIVQEQAVTTIATVADAAREHFKKYYPWVVGLWVSSSPYLFYLPVSYPSFPSLPPSLLSCASSSSLRVFVPHLKHILANAREKSHRMLRAKTLECVSLMGLAVGKEMVGVEVRRGGKCVCVLAG